MNSAELGGIVRTLASAAFGYLAGKGYFDSETAQALAGAIGTVFVAVWSVLAKRKAEA